MQSYAVIHQRTEIRKRKITKDNILLAKMHQFWSKFSVLFCSKINHQAYWSYKEKHQINKRKYANTNVKSIVMNHSYEFIKKPIKCQQITGGNCLRKPERSIFSGSSVGWEVVEDTFDKMQKLCSICSIFCNNFFIQWKPLNVITLVNAISLLMWSHFEIPFTIAHYIKTAGY